MSGAELSTAVLLHGSVQMALDTLRLLFLPVLIVLPGLALARLLRPGSVTPWWWFTWGLGAGMVGLLLCRIVFQAVGVSNPRLWVGPLTAVCLVLVSLAPARRQNAADTRPASPDAPFAPVTPVARNQALLLAVAVAIAAGAVTIGRDGAAQASQKAYTEFWAVPDRQGLRIGVRNREGHATGYRVELRRGPQTLAQWKVPPLSSGAADEWHFRPEPDTAEPRADSWQLLLYRNGDAQVYRHVSLQP